MMMYHMKSAVVAGLASLCLAALAPAQTLVTDKDDYQPGETVYFSGSGFEAGEMVAIALQVEDTRDKHLDYSVGGLVVDAYGKFTATWIVPQEALNTFITATAIGLSSGRVATTTFTDAETNWAYPQTATLTGSGNTLTLAVTIATAGLGGGYFDKGSVRGVLKSAGYPDVVVPLSYVSGGAPRTCCFPNGLRSFDGPTVDHAAFEGSVVLPTGRTYTFYKTIMDYGFSVGGGPCNVVVNNEHGLGAFVGIPPLLIPFGARIPPPVTTSGQTCPTNAAPSLSLTDKDLGELVGCLTSSGTFTRDVTVASSDFAPVATDPDGDPVTVSFQGPSNFTFVGPGLVEGEVTFKATDDPSARAAVSSCTLDPESVTRKAKVIARIVYAFDGPDKPLTIGQTLLNKQGRSVPIKFRLRDKSGVEVSPTNSVLFGSAASIPELDVRAISMMAPSGPSLTEDTGTANDDGSSFRYSGTTGVDGKWIYNLSTKGPGWTSGVLYRATVRLNDGTERAVHFSLRK